MNIGRKSSSCLVLAGLCANAFLSGCASSGQWNIENPYAEVNWPQHRQIKANFHTHTTQSDGRMTPEEVIDKYQRLNYGVLALTDHNKITWPWEDNDRAPDRLEMIAVPGSEPSRHHHMGAYFCRVPGASSEKETLAQVRDQDGAAVIFHPGRYEWTANEYVALYKEWDELIGMEIFNQGDRYPGDRHTWDKILTVLMPESRPVWGFSNDDMHAGSQLGRNWNVLLLPELSPDAVRTSMEQGAFFFVYAPRGHEGAGPPAIQSLEVDSHKGIIRIKATDHERIEWISSGGVVCEGDAIELSTKPGVHGYVRAVVHAEEGGSIIGTQPFGVRPVD